MENKFVLNIDGTEYEFMDEIEFVGANTPVIDFEGKKYLGKAIKKESTIPDKDLDWEIVSGGENYIHTVKRLPDNEIYSTGDFAEVIVDQSSIKFIIKKFELEPYNNLMVCLVNSNARYNITMLEPKVKPKVPLFTTEDGVKVFKEDDTRYFVAISIENFAFYSSYYLGLEKNSDVLVFADFKKAEEYILNNKPIEVSYKEISKSFMDYGNVQFDAFDALKDFFKSKINL